MRGGAAQGKACPCSPRPGIQAPAYVVGSLQDIALQLELDRHLRDAFEDVDVSTFTPLSDAGASSMGRFTARSTSDGLAQG